MVYVPLVIGAVELAKLALSFYFKASAMAGLTREEMDAMYKDASERFDSKESITPPPEIDP